MEKVVGNRGDPVIYVRNSKDFKITRKKKIQERSNPCTGNRYILSTQTRYSTIIIYHNRQEV